MNSTDANHTTPYIQENGSRTLVSKLTQRVGEEANHDKTTLYMKASKNIVQKNL